MAVIKLTAPIGLSAGWMGVYEPCGEASPVRYVAHTAGYPSDMPAGSCKFTQCAVSQSPCTDAYLYHKCDTASGQSGSPMWMLAMTPAKKMGPYIRAVHNIEWCVVAACRTARDARVDLWQRPLKCGASLLRRRAPDENSLCICCCCCSLSLSLSAVCPYASWPGSMLGAYLLLSSSPLPLSPAWPRRVQSASSGGSESYINSAVSITPDHYRTVLAWVAPSWANATFAAAARSAPLAPTRPLQ